ncbi:MAG: hypothetical protein ACOYMD_02880 [Paludibacter sp.]
MKKSNLNFLMSLTIVLFLFQSQLTGQNLKSLINKVAENETVKKTVDAIKENEAVKSTVEAVKASVQQDINAKIEELTNPKPQVPVKSPAQALAPDVKNTISEVRTFTGLTADELSAKMITLGFAIGTDDLALGGVVYKSKTAGYTLSITMGLRNSISYVREVTKATVSKKANLVTVKTNFLKLGTQITDLKAVFSNAAIAAKSAKGTNVAVQNPADRTSKFLPALDKFSSKKEDGTVTEVYTENDYGYELKLSQTTTKAGSTAITMVKVIDKTIE